MDFSELQGRSMCMLHCAPALAAGGEGNVIPTTARQERAGAVIGAAALRLLLRKIRTVLLSVDVSRWHPPTTRELHGTVSFCIRGLRDERTARWQSMRTVLHTRWLLARTCSRRERHIASAVETRLRYSTASTLSTHTASSGRRATFRNEHCRSE